MPVRSRSSAEKDGNCATLKERKRSSGVAACSGSLYGKMPAPAHDASLPSSFWSNTIDGTPPRASKYAVVKPMTPPPTITTLLREAMQVLYVRRPRAGISP